MQSVPHEVSMDSAFPPVATGPQSGKREGTGINSDFDTATPQAGSSGEQTNGRLNHRKYEQAYAEYRLAQNGTDEKMSSTKLTHNDKGYRSSCSHATSNPVESPRLQGATNEGSERNNHADALIDGRCNE